MSMNSRFGTVLLDVKGTVVGNSNVGVGGQLVGEVMSFLGRMYVRDMGEDKDVVRFSDGTPAMSSLGVRSGNGRGTRVITQRNTV